MQPLPNLLIICGFILMGMAFTFAVFRTMKGSGGIWGKPSVHPVVFYAGKLSMFLAWSMMLLKAIIPSLPEAAPSLLHGWPSVVLFSTGLLIIAASFVNLGTALKYGLPEGETRLQTGGLYRYSRHPLYTGVFITMVASALFYVHPLNILSALVCMGAHIPMIRSEERFLAARFGEEWNGYKRQVRMFF